MQFLTWVNGLKTSLSLLLVQDQYFCRMICNDICVREKQLGFAWIWIIILQKYILYSCFVLIHGVVVHFILSIERLWSNRETISSGNITLTALPRLHYFRCLLNRRGVQAAPVTNYYARQPPSGPGSCYEQ
jgi:hypothetical protein